MLKGKLIHPEVLGALGTLGHGSQILLADGNYPVGTRLGPGTHPVYLNLMPGVPTVTQVLDALLSAVPVEAASVMVPPESPEPAVFEEFRSLLRAAGAPTELEELGRYEFYEAASGPEVGLAILTGEERVYANLLVTIGVVAPPE